MAGKRRRNPVTDAEILAMYRETFSPKVVAKHFGIGGSTVERVLVKYAEPRAGLNLYRLRATKYLGKERAMRRAYERGATLAQVREQFGAPGDADYAVKQALRRAGTVLRENPARRESAREVSKVRKMNAAGKGQVPISLALGRSQSFVARLMKRHGIAPLSDRMKGESHPGWKGGRYIDGNGYVRVQIDASDPLATMAHSSGYVPEHRLVMARKLGRPLLRSETVHHINGDRTDNRVENLQLRQGKHGKHVVMVCRDCGSRNIGHSHLEDC